MPTSICAKTNERLSIWVGVVATQQPHGYSGWPGNGFGDVLTRRLNGLPVPLLSLLDDIAQTWEGEVKGMY